ncbi:MAG TPA: RcpC/CpaB family pilus assembly protein [Acidimicrobiia bacterium]
MVVVLAGLLGGVLTLASLRADAHEVRVVVAAHDLRVGARLEPGDVRSVAVRGDIDNLGALVRDSHAAGLVGHVVTAPVRRGDPLRGSDFVVATPNNARVMSFTVDESDAVAGDLQAGDRIDVVAISHDTKDAGYVLVDAPVLAAAHAGGASGPLHTNDSGIVITVSVSAEDALRLAGAQADARVIVIDATGTAPLTGAPRYPIPGSTAGANPLEVHGG